MKKEYKQPSIEIIEILVQNIIAASSPDLGDGETDGADRAPERRGLWR